MVLHIKRALKLKVYRVFGFVKDRIAIGQAKLLRDRRRSPLQVSVICATSHKESPPEEELVSLILQAGTGSRMRISHCVNLLIERLSKTKSWIVALKCLTLMHKALHHGGFIYQDQLSFHPRNGGNNYLNMSRFRDRSSPFAWEASSWVRWYANFLEALVEASKCIGGGFLDADARVLSSEKVLGLSNHVLMAMIISLSALLQEICNCPQAVTNHSLIRDSLRLVVTDCITAQNQIRIHIKEICRRVDDLSVCQICELLRVNKELTSESESLTELTKLAFSLRILRPHQRLDEILFSDCELTHIKAALTAVHVSDKALVTTEPKRKGLSNGANFSLKLPPPMDWTSGKLLQRRPQLAVLRS